MSNTKPHPIMAKYGLETMAGDPLEVLERHLVNNHAAAVGGYISVANALRSQLELVETALRKWVTAEDELPLAGFSCDCPVGDDDEMCEHTTLAHDWMQRVEAARNGARAALAALPRGAK
jgi:hypothetical protein